MKKQLLTLVAILLGITALQAKELYKVQFGKDYNSKGITSYSGSFDVKLNKSDTEDFATVKNCNNNNNGWSYVRLGGKNACVASITTKKAIEEKIDQIDLRLYKREANSSISVKLCVCPDSKFETNVTTYDITSEISALSVDKNSITEPTQPTVSVDITPVSGMYYKLEFDMPKLSNNGGIQLHTIVFNGEEDNGKTDIGLAFSADEVSYDIVGEAALVTPTLSRAAGFEDVPVVYSSSNEAVATVAADGTVTPLTKGTTTITASVPDDNATYSGTASYTLRVISSNTLEKTFDFVNETYDMTRYSGTTSAYNPNPLKIQSGNVSVTLTGQNRLWSDGLRFYDGSGFSVSVPDGYVVTEISMTGSAAFTCGGKSFGSSNSWSGEEQAVDFEFSGKSGSPIKTLCVKYEKTEQKTDIGLAYSSAEVTYDLAGTAAFEAPTLSMEVEGVDLVYSSSNEAVATVAADGTVTPLAKGTTTITASVPEDNATYSGSALYTLVLANSDLLEDTFDFTKANAYGILTGNSNSDLSKADFECVEGVVTMGYKYKSGTGYRIFNSSGSGYELRIQKQSSGASAGTLTFSVGKGYKITSIKMEGDAVTKSDLSFAEGVYNYGSKVGTWEPSDAKVYKSVSVEVTDQVKVRTITVAFARVPIAGMAVINHDENQVTITAEEGATIYYTTDNSEPTTDSDVYSAPFGITETSTIKALVVVPEKEESDVATYEALYVVAPQTTWEAHNKAATEALGLESSGVIDPTQPDYNRFMLTGIQGGVYFTIVAPEGHDLWISLDGQGSASTVKKVASYAFVPTPKAEDIELHKVEGGRAEKVVVQYSGTLRYYSVHPESGKSSNVMVISFSGTTGVEDITVDGSSNAEVEYYDLQGVRVANPENGLYIRRQGNSVTKVLVK